MIQKFEIPCRPGLHMFKANGSAWVNMLSVSAECGTLYVWADTDPREHLCKNYVLVLAEGERIPPHTADKLLGVVDTENFGRLHVFDGFMVASRRGY